MYTEMYKKTWKEGYQTYCDYLWEGGRRGQMMQLLKGMYVIFLYFTKIKYMGKSEGLLSIKMISYSDATLV